MPSLLIDCLCAHDISSSPEELLIGEMSTLPSKEPHQGPLEVNAGHNQASPEVGACANGHKQASTSTRIKDTLIKSKKKLEDI